MGWTAVNHDGSPQIGQIEVDHCGSRRNREL